MKKYSKIIIIFTIILIAIIVLKFITNVPVPTKISNYLVENGYIKNNDLFSKQISDLSLNEYQYYVSKNIPATYSINYFSIGNFRLTKNLDNYQDKITTSLTEIYDYKDNSLTYTYRITSNDVNAIFKGEYKETNKEFICQKEFAYGVITNSFQNTICEGIELQVSNFSLEAKLLFKNATFINYMKKQKVE